MKVVRTNKQEVVVVHDNLTEDRARGMVEEAVRCAKCVTVENYGSLHKIDVYHHEEEPVYGFNPFSPFKKGLHKFLKEWREQDSKATLTLISINGENACKQLFISVDDVFGDLISMDITDSSGMVNFVTGVFTFSVKALNGEEREYVFKISDFDTATKNTNSIFDCDSREFMRQCSFTDVFMEISQTPCNLFHFSPSTDQGRLSAQKSQI